MPNPTNPTITPTERHRDEAWSLVCEASMSDFQARHLSEKIAQALAIARREGAEDMRERCADLLDPKAREPKGGLTPGTLVRRAVWITMREAAKNLRSLPLTEKDER